jgi:hypothetical protein
MLLVLLVLLLRPRLLLLIFQVGADAAMALEVNWTPAALLWTCSRAMRQAILNLLAPCLETRQNIDNSARSGGA